MCQAVLSLAPPARLALAYHRSNRWCWRLPLARFWFRRRGFGKNRIDRSKARRRLGLDPLRRSFNSFLNCRFDAGFQCLLAWAAVFTARRTLTSAAAALTVTAPTVAAATALATIFTAALTLFVVIAGCGVPGFITHGGGLTISIIARGSNAWLVTQTRNAGRHFLQRPDIVIATTSTPAATPALAALTITAFASLPLAFGPLFFRRFV